MPLGGGGLRRGNGGGLLPRVHAAARGEERQVASRAGEGVLECECDRKHMHVELPPEDAKEGYFAKFMKWLYRLLGAARGWED